MGMTQKEWKTWMEGLTDEQLADISNHCGSLMVFDKICSEYRWTGIGLIGTLAGEVLRERGDQE